MATIGDLTTELESNFLFRVDLTSSLYIFMRNFYRVLCSKVPFEELQLRSNFNCVIGNAEVDLSSLKLAGIMSIYIEYSSSPSQGIRLKRSHTRLYDNMGTMPNGRPHTYARFNKKIELLPPPDNTYTLKVRYWQTADINATVQNTTIVAPDAWHELIQWETYYRALMVLNRFNDAQNLILTSMQPKMPSPKKVVEADLGIIPRLWNELLTTIQEREFIDEEFGINPLVRS